jgi:hypothetical protein
VRRLAAAAVLLLLPACGRLEQPATGDGVAMERYGITLEVPARWDAELTRGIVAIGRDGLRARLFERQIGRDLPQREADSFFPAVERAPRLEAGDFAPPEPGTYTNVDGGFVNRPFSLSGRLFVLFAASETRPPDERALAALNAALASLVVEPGDFYDGMVEPARFAARPGWYTGSEGPAEIQAQGEATLSWAVTIP